MTADTPERRPTGWATYPGDATGILDEGPKGRSYLGEFQWPVVATYDDAATNTTRVGFSLLPPPDVESALRHSLIARRAASAMAARLAGFAR